MFGCLGRLGCLALFILGAAVAWLMRDRWQPLVFGDRETSVATWESMSDSAATRAGRAVQSLSGPSGPGYVTLTAAELASLIASQAGGALPPSVDSVQAAIEGDRVRLRAMINLDDLRGIEGLGPLSSLLNRRERFETQGRLDIVRPGLAQFLVQSAQIGEFPIPQAAIPRLLGQLARAARPDSVAANGIPFAVPEHVGDVRVDRGRVILYRRVP